MKTMKWVTVTLVLALVSISCQLFAPTGNKDGLQAGDVKRVFSEQPVLDLQAPLPSPGAAAMRVLSGWDPGAAGLQGKVEAAERAALSSFIDMLKAQTGSGLEPAFLPAQAIRVPVTPLSRGFTLPVSYHRQANTDGLIDTAHDASLIAGLVTGLGQIISDKMPAGSNVNPTQTTKDGDTDVTVSGEIGKNADGSTQFGLGLKTETVKDGATTSTDMNAKVDGQRCPTAEGQVSFTVKVRLGANSGGNGFTQELTAFVRAVVDDNAQIATTTIDVIQATQQTKNGRMVYLESGQTIQYNADDMATLQYSNLHLSQKTDNITLAEGREISGNGHDAALSMGRTALLVAQDNWRGGGCVQIEATSPGKVKPGSDTPIAVTVLHKFDGSRVPSKLEAALSGETSLVPTSLAKTPGTLTYTAPGQNGKSATIKLTATSRRGIATLDLSANTGGQSFKLNADSNGAHFSATICSLDQPFEIILAASGETWTESATPNSSVDGTLAGTYSVEGCTFTGSGPYNIIMNTNGSATMQWTNNWTADCPGLGSKSGVVSHELPLQPAPDNACSK